MQNPLVQVARFVTIATAILLGVAVVRGVTGLSLRYRQADGAWRERWDALKPAYLPRLVEVTLTLEGRAPVTLSYLVGTGA